MRRCVSTRAIFLQAFHDDPVQLAAQRAAQAGRVGAAAPGDFLGRGPGRRRGRCALAPRRGGDARAGSQRLLLEEHARNLRDGRAAQRGRIEGRYAGEQLIRQHAQRVDVRPRVYVQPGMLGLLGRHVFQRADDLPELRVHGLLGQPGVHGLGDSEIDDLGNGLVGVEHDQHVGRLDVAVDDAFLMRVLHRVAHRDQQPQPVADRQSLAVTELGDGNAAHPFHHEVRPAGLRRTGIEHAGDIRVIHHGQGLALGLEAGDDGLCIHAQLDDLERDLALDRRRLLGQIHRSESAFADHLQQPIRADLAAGAFGGRRDEGVDAGGRRRTAGTGVCGGFHRMGPIETECMRGAHPPHAGLASAAHCANQLVYTACSRM